MPSRLECYVLCFTFYVRSKALKIVSSFKFQVLRLKTEYLDSGICRNDVPLLKRLPRFGARDRKEGVAFLQEIPVGCNDGVGEKGKERLRTKD